MSVAFLCSAIVLVSPDASPLQPVTRNAYRVIHMSRVSRCVLPGVLCLLGGAMAGCGGGATAYSQPTPALADFSLALSVSSLSIAQSGSSSVSFSVQPQNGFSGSVQVVLNGVPADVTSTPASPFSVATGNSTSVVLAARRLRLREISSFPHEEPPALSRMPPTSLLWCKAQRSLGFLAPLTKERTPPLRRTIRSASRIITISRMIPPTSAYSLPTAP